MPRNLKADSSKPCGTFHSFFSRGKFGWVSKEKNLLDGWVRTMQGAASAASEGAAAAPVKLNSQKRSMDHAERCSLQATTYNSTAASSFFPAAEVCYTLSITSLYRGMSSRSSSSSSCHA